MLFKTMKSSQFLNMDQSRIWSVDGSVDVTSLSGTFALLLFNCCHEDQDATVITHIYLVFIQSTRVNDSTSFTSFRAGTSLGRGPQTDRLSAMKSAFSVGV